jgi:hypothetical protein
MAINTNSHTSSLHHGKLMLFIFATIYLGTCDGSLNKTSCSGLVPASSADCKRDHPLSDPLQVKRQHESMGYTCHCAGIYVVAILYIYNNDSSQRHSSACLTRLKLLTSSVILLHVLTLRLPGRGRPKVSSLASIGAEPDSDASDQQHHHRTLATMLSSDAYSQSSTLTLKLTAVNGRAVNVAMQPSPADRIKLC